MNMLLFGKKYLMITIKYAMITITYSLCANRSIGEFLPTVGHRTGGAHKGREVAEDADGGHLRGLVKVVAGAVGHPVEVVEEVHRRVRGRCQCAMALLCILVKIRRRLLFGTSSFICGWDFICICGLTRPKRINWLFHGVNHRVLHGPPLAPIYAQCQSPEL